MKHVQLALQNVDVPVMRGIWRQTEDSSVVVPEHYIVYSTTRVPYGESDDRVTQERTYVYMNLWSSVDPTEVVESVRSAMLGYGFGCVEESDRGYNQPAYNSFTHTFCTSWTWVYYEDADYAIRL